MPFFSIIIPCYNQAHFLDECICSVQAQSFQDWELIIVNDGSTDNTQQIAERFSANDQRIHVINKSNGGLSSARNAGMTMASGHYLQFLDSDDIILKDALAGVYEHAQQNNSDLIHGGYVYVDESNKNTIHKVTPYILEHLLPFLLSSNIGPCHSIFIKRSFALQLDGFDESLKSAEDWDFWMRAAKAGATVKTLNRTLVAYRYVGDSMSRDAFRMYHALKTVTLRAPHRDERIKIESTVNINYDIKVTDTLKFQLSRCLGISIMQGKIQESIDLYKQESFEYGFQFEAGDFKPMYSYLSFRYWNSAKEIDFILTVFNPKFRQFLEGVGYSTSETRQALKEIFTPVYRMKNRRRYGTLMGGIFNRILY